MTRAEAFKILDALKPDKNGCVVFTGVRNTSRPGHRAFISIDKLQVPAHRFALERKLGRPIAQGFQARHLCGNPSCVNPAHLVEQNGRAHG
jgi:hypothetical protein